MQINFSPKFKDYTLIDSGGGEKLERYGEFILRRPEPQAIWHKSLTEQQWEQKANATFTRDINNSEKGEWRLKKGMPERWVIGYQYKDMQLRFRLGLTSFKHLGIFPEQASNWNFIYDNCKAHESGCKVLNMFAYTGGATLAARAGGAEVTHNDSVKQVVTWARENMELSGLEGVRWIVEDALRFAEREVRRGNKYDGIILDPPAYGRGANGEKWVLESNLAYMLELCSKLLAEKGAFLVLNLYSMGLSSTIARTAIRQNFTDIAAEEFGELYFTDLAGKDLPLGTYYRFTK